jgi:hypothetical protein
MRPGALRAATARAAACLGNTRTRLTAGEKPNRKRMATLVAVYDVEPAKRRPHDVIAPPGGRHGARELRPGPRARGKWLAGSVRHDPAEMIAAAFGEAEARDPQPADLGCPGRRGRAPAGPDPRRGRTPRRHDSGRHRPRPRAVHLESRLEPARDRRPAAEDWVAAKALAILARGSGRASGEITGQAGSVGLCGSQRNGADACALPERQARNSCAAPRPSRMAGPSRPALSREHAGTSSPTAST